VRHFVNLQQRHAIFPLVCYPSPVEMELNRLKSIAWFQVRYRVKFEMPKIKVVNQFNEKKDSKVYLSNIQKSVTAILHMAPKAFNLSPFTFSL
jgi:hypothetical protein